MKTATTANSRKQRPGNKPKTRIKNHHLPLNKAKIRAILEKAYAELQQLPPCGVVLSKLQVRLTRGIRGIKNPHQPGPIALKIHRLAVLFNEHCNRGSFYKAGKLDPDLVDEFYTLMTRPYDDSVGDHVPLDLLGIQDLLTMAVIWTTIGRDAWKDRKKNPVFYRKCIVELEDILTSLQRGIVGHRDSGNTPRVWKKEKRLGALFQRCLKTGTAKRHDMGARFLEIMTGK